MLTTRQLWKICDRRRFLIAAMQELAGRAHISFEGDLGFMTARLTGDESEEETSALKRNTRWPRQDFVVFPLEPDRIQAIISTLGGTLPGTLLHIQIEKDGRLELGLYDKFDPNSAFFGQALSSDFFDLLQAEGILKPWAERPIRS